MYFIISSFSVQITHFSWTMPYNLNTHLSRIKVNWNFGCLFYESDFIHFLKWMKVFILWTQTVLGNKYGTHSGGGQSSSVGIATELQAGRSGIESRWGRDFPSVQTGPGAHPASCKMGTGSLPGVKCGRGVLLTIHPLLVPRSWKSRAIPLPTLWATPGL